MIVTEKAGKRLKHLLKRHPGAPKGLRYKGKIGTCKGSSPVFKPAEAPDENEESVNSDGLVFFVKKGDLELFDSATIDYDNSFLGKGLTMTWPHCPECHCSN